MRTLGLAGIRIRDTIGPTDSGHGGITATWFYAEGSVGVSVSMDQGMWAGISK